jgi:hypothetical protein
VVGFYVSTPIKPHEYPPHPIIVRAETRLIEDETAAGTQTGSCQAQYFVNLLVGEVMEHSQRKKCVGTLRQLPNSWAAGISAEEFSTAPIS